MCVPNYRGTVLNIYIHNKPLTPTYFFDSLSENAENLVDIDIEPKVPGKHKKLICHICQAVITDDTCRINILGSNDHYRINPAGITYYFECFREAPGCDVLGTSTEEYTWFSNYKWQLAMCKECREHLGWLFKGPDRFFALIKGKVLTDLD